MITGPDPEEYLCAALMAIVATAAFDILPDAREDSAQQMEGR